MKTRIASLALLALLLAVAAPARASLIFNLVESGSGVTLTGSGSFNFGGSLSNTPGAIGSVLFPSSVGVIAEVGPMIPANGLTPTHLVALGAIVSGGPASFGSGLSSPVATSSSGDTFGFAAGIRDVILPLGYTSGTALSGQTFWSGATLASLGADPGTYVWQTSYGGVNDTITLNVTPVPEPSSLALAGTGAAFAGLALSHRRRRATA